MVVVITSGGFDPIHVGHLEYLTSAKRNTHANIHVCIVNNDEFLMRKKGYFVQKQNDRLAIIGQIKDVDIAFKSFDTDDTVCDSLIRLREYFPLAHLIFYKDGDRNEYNIPEASVCDRLNIQIVAGNHKKLTSSSEIINRLKEDICQTS